MMVAIRGEKGKYQQETPRRYLAVFAGVLSYPTNSIYLYR
jgi:hypothetical protein